MKWSFGGCALRWPIELSLHRKYTQSARKMETSLDRCFYLVSVRIPALHALQQLRKFVSPCLLRRDSVYLPFLHGLMSLHTLCNAVTHRECIGRRQCTWNSVGYSLRSRFSREPPADPLLCARSPTVIHRDPGRCCLDRRNSVWPTKLSSATWLSEGVVPGRGVSIETFYSGSTVSGRLVVFHRWRQVRIDGKE